MFADNVESNWWYRVAIHKTIDEEMVTLRFEHPTQPGTLVGGWMERLEKLGQDIANNPVFDRSSLQTTELTKPIEGQEKKSPIIMTRKGLDRKITQEELELHNTEGQPWFVVDGEVYDGTAFLQKHPGGAESITLVAGTDASEDFMAIHSVVCTPS
jgi:nitrate reductase (NAD(P)H)